MAQTLKPQIQLTTHELQLLQQLHDLTGKDHNEIIDNALATWMETLKGIPQEFQAVHWGIDAW